MKKIITTVVLALIAHSTAYASSDADVSLSISHDENSDSIRFDLENLSKTTNYRCNFSIRGYFADQEGQIKNVTTFTFRDALLFRNKQISISKKYDEFRKKEDQGLKFKEFDYGSVKQDCINETASWAALATPDEGYILHGAKVITPQAIFGFTRTNQQITSIFSYSKKGQKIFQKVIGKLDEEPRIIKGQNDNVYFTEYYSQGTVNKLTRTNSTGSNYTAVTIDQCKWIYGFNITANGDILIECAEIIDLPTGNGSRGMIKNITIKKYDSDLKKLNEQKLDILQYLKNNELEFKIPGEETSYKLSEILKKSGFSFDNFLMDQRQRKTRFFSSDNNRLIIDGNKIYLPLSLVFTKSMKDFVNQNELALRIPEASTTHPALPVLIIQGDLILDKNLNILSFKHSDFQPNLMDFYINELKKDPKTLMEEFTSFKIISSINKNDGSNRPIIPLVNYKEVGARKDLMLPYEMYISSKNDFNYFFKIDETNGIKFLINKKDKQGNLIWKTSITMKSIVQTFFDDAFLELVKSRTSHVSEPVDELGLKRYSYNVLGLGLDWLVNDHLIDSEENIWISTSSGALKIDNKTGNIVLAKRIAGHELHAEMWDPKITNQLPTSNRITDIDEDGNIVFSSQVMRTDWSSGVAKSDLRYGFQYVVKDDFETEMAK